MNSFKIADFEISDASAPFIIAEMSGNHNQSLEKALEIVDAAADAGAHALKIQTYTADTMTIPCDKGLFYIDDPKSLWHGKTLHDLYQIAYTPWEWHKPIFDRAKERGLIPFSTPFDATSVDFLEELDVPVYKIASFENKDWPLLKKVAKTGKPVIMSTGASTLSDIAGSVSVLRENGCKDLILLKCTSTYPASPKNTNLATISHMREMFGCYTGLSDHTGGIGAAVASVAFGARVIEKHFTISREEGGVDAAFSIEPAELQALVIESKRAWEAVGEVKYEILKDENASLRFKRSVYVVNEIKKGEMFTEKNVRIIRPGDGMEPRYYESILGKVAIKDFERGTPLTWNDL
ncbi:pseudaminic acid synthase [bacterium SCSIO 12643]|nr:pseudaminic acid synthase [bacterium SCSIO 12643]